MFVIYFLLLTNIFKLQIINGGEYQTRASQNRFRILPIKAKRGLFYDLTGQVLVQNINNVRKYLYPYSFAHLLGYTGEANENELIHFGVDMGEQVGKLGLERSYEGVLHGVNGGEVVEFSSLGKKLRVLSRNEPQQGQNIQLFIDLGLQNFTYKLLEDSGYLGSIIVSTPDNHILSIASFPSFDSNVFTNLNNNGIKNILADSKNPMFFRAISGVYPPASIFKIVTLLAALMEHSIDLNYQIEDQGFVKVGNFRYGNWYYDQYGRTEGIVDIPKSLARSNDTFYYIVGGDLGITKLSVWASKLGFGKKTGIKLDGEADGLVPNKDWKLENLKEDWYLGDTYITSIGQGNLQTTPLQVHQLMAFVANQGWLCKPKLVSTIFLDDLPQLMSVDHLVDDQNCQNLDIDQDFLEITQKGLINACKPGGTAWPLFNFSVKNKNLLSEIDESNYIKQASSSADQIFIPIACKTGTAETGKSIIKNNKKIYLNHAWLTAYAPANNPEIVVTVMLEEAGQGSDKAGPLVKQIFNYYFTKMK